MSLFRAAASGGANVSGADKGEMKIKPVEMCVVLAIIIALALVCYSRNVKWDLRYSMWNDVLEKSATKWRPHYRMGLILHQGGRYGEALSSLSHAYELKPDARGILNNMGLAYQRMGRLREAAAMYGRSIDTGDNPSLAHMNLGTLYMGQGRLDAALRSFNLALEADPRNTVALVNAGFAYSDKGEFREAAKLHKQAILVNPYYANAYYGMAIALEGTGDNAGAIKEWQRYLEVGPKAGPWRERALANIQRLSLSQ